MPQPMHISEALRLGLAKIVTQDSDGKRLPTAYIMPQLSPNFFQETLEEFARRDAPADKMNSAQVGQWLGLGWFLATDKPKTVAEYCVWLADLSQVLFEECQERAENEGAPSQADIDKAIAEGLSTASDVDKAKWQLAQAERFTR